MSAQPQSAGRPSPWPALLTFLALCYAVAAIGGWATASSVDSWYAALRKPSFNPPNAVFGPVWTTLYAMIAVAGFRLWRRRAVPGAPAALAAWGVQLALNLLWSLLFFGARRIGLALAEVLLLDLAILATVALAFRVDRVSALLLLPYLAWTSFATVLNLAIARLN
jgi:tryptophan-rich sensory protein